MLTLISRYSTQILACCVLLGFALPSLANTLLPFLPTILFVLMLFTIISLDIKTLLQDLAQRSVWLYAIWHSLGVTILVMSLLWLFQIDNRLYLAIAASCATGSLFASPAIVRSIGLDAQRCMAMTIASTLVMPMVLLLNGLVFSRFSASEQLQLDMQIYSQRLAIFIILPVLISVVAHKLIKQSQIERALLTIRPVTIVLVLFFPLGLMGAFRETYDLDPAQAWQYLAIAFAVSCLLFMSSFFLYIKQGKQQALICAITATNRNVLLTYSITGGFLGMEFLIYMGALQLPIYLLPLLVRQLVRPS